ncbi:myoD family inhibitor isoform X1 [Sagmatias obliquidens]|uniref:myoD family inhibitor isoform X1 n=1 Tax=Sagmatias obliquidens TaxID=3371155 RepID=UPI000F44579A|nr:myoD family inhibitor isoform X1 [Lagenorhynchus obliquidens]
MRPSSRTQTDPGWLPEFQAGPRTRLRGRGSRTPSSRPGGPPLPAEPPGLIAGTRPRVAKALGTTAVLASTAPRGPSSVTLSLLPGLEVVTGSAQPAESALEEGSLEEAAPLMPQSNGPGASQALDSTDLDIPTEAVTRQPQGNPLGCTPLVANGSGHPSELGGTRRTGNGALGGPKAHRKLQTHPSLASQGSKKSKGSTKSAASQIPLQAQEDCCVHCILSCLFCEFLTLCNIVLDCATCGSCSSEDSCLCCCCCGSGECADCDLPCDLDCGILDACCESADCLEICMECCGLCFSS